MRLPYRKPTEEERSKDKSDSIHSSALGQALPPGIQTFHLPTLHFLSLEVYLGFWLLSSPLRESGGPNSLSSTIIPQTKRHLYSSRQPASRSLSQAHPQDLISVYHSDIPASELTSILLSHLSLPLSSNRLISVTVLLATHASKWLILAMIIYPPQSTSPESWHGSRL